MKYVNVLIPDTNKYQIPCMGLDINNLILIDLNEMLIINRS